MTGRALSVNWADRTLPAIVEAWYPGGEAGQAVAELIAGDFSPAGRLPITVPKSANDLPPFTDYGMNGRTYRYASAEPLYPFGYGLSYTNFAYGAPRLDRARVAAGGSTRLSVDVRNTGQRAGDEVVQLYAGRDKAGTPRRSLVGFQRISLRPGEVRTVTFTIDAKATSIVDTRGNRVVEPGPVQLWVGGGQPGRGTAGQPARLIVTGRKGIAKF
jgi:beta-glucosidase